MQKHTGLEAHWSRRAGSDGHPRTGVLGGDGGFYDYYDDYVSVPVRTNDQKSVGAFMFLSTALSDIANPGASSATRTR